MRLDNGSRLVIKSTSPVSDGFSEPVLPIDIVGPAGPVGIVGLLEPITGPVSDGPPSLLFLLIFPDQPSY